MLHPEIPMEFEEENPFTQWTKAQKIARLQNLISMKATFLIGKGILKELKYLFLFKTLMCFSPMF